MEKIRERKTRETKEEVIDTIYDLKEAKVDVVTIGQYLQPSKKHLQVQRFVTPDEFLEYKELGEKLGFKHFDRLPTNRAQCISIEK